MRWNKINITTQNGPDKAEIKVWAAVVIFQCTENAAAAMRNIYACSLGESAGCVFDWPWGGVGQKVKKHDVNHSGGSH